MAGNNSLRILLVDDDRDLLDLLKYNFQKEGFVVETVSKVNNVISAARRFQPDLIVLDVIMPDGNGIELCKKIRGDSQFEHIYIFVLTALSENYYRNAALDIGADDFIEKLSGIRALTNKVSAVLKNKFIIKKGISSLTADDLILKKRSQLLYRRNKKIMLTKPEFEILFFLMQNPNTAISRKDLIRIIWGSEMYVLDSSVQTYIINLQRKVGNNRIENLNYDRYRFNQVAH